MPIFHLTPIPDRLGDPAWATCAFRGECWVNAANEIEARRLADSYFDARQTRAHGGCRGPSPWLQPRLVAAARYPRPPLGHDIAPGMVLATPLL